VLAASAAVTVQAWRAARADESRALRAALGFEVRRVELRILERMRAYEQVLRGAAGLFDASEEVTRAEFRAYVAALALDEHYPGIQGVGFALLVPAAQRAAHEAAVRREGFPEFAIKPEGARDPYTSIVFLEPFADRNLRAFGYDMFSEPVRREAMLRARDTGRAALTGRVRLVQETTSDVQAGALLYLPLYRAGGRTVRAEEPGAALFAWVYSPYRMGDLMRGMLGDRVSEVGLALYDGDDVSPAGLLHDSLRVGVEPAPSPPAGLSARRQLEIAGHRWTLVARALPAFEARLASGRPLLVALVGAGAGALFALLVYVLAEGRARALRTAERARRDLEERRRAAEALQAAQQALAESEARLRTAVVASGQVPWEQALDGGRLVFGDGLRELLGSDPPAALDADAWTGLMHPDDAPASRAKLDDCAQGRSERFDSEYRLRTARGWRWVQSQGRVTAHDEQGRPLRLSGTLAEVHDLRALQQKLLASTRLASVGTLAAGVAHEINNPLTWMHANLDVALERLSEPVGDSAAAAERDAWLRQLLGESLQGVERIAGIVKAMRSLGRPERAGLARPVDVRAELLDAAKMVRHQLEQRATLDLRLPEDLPPVLAPTSELGRVFLNLLLNAAQALPEGDPARHRVTVAAWGEAGEVLVEVSDTGPGLSQEVRERLFEPFFTTKPVGQGTGLGLSIARSIVEAAGGRIEVGAERGQGATFRVRLPAAAPAAGQAASAARPRDPGARPRRRVLLVDDEPTAAAALARRLEQAHDVTVLGAGEEVLRHLERGERWDALLVDLMMPGIDGIGLHQALAARWPDLLPRVAFVTGGAFGGRATRFLAEHDVPVVAKPVALEPLLEVVERLAAGAGPGAA
jgi:PAS domain S-box-containing protein